MRKNSVVLTYNNGTATVYRRMAFDYKTYGTGRTVFKITGIQNVPGEAPLTYIKAVTTQ